MERCRTCEGTIAKNETECITCGTPVKPKKDPNKGRARFSKIVTGMLIASVLLTLAGLFTDYGPPFMTGVAVCIVLVLVKKSADDMLVDSMENSGK